MFSVTSFQLSEKDKQNKLKGISLLTEN